MKYGDDAELALTSVKYGESSSRVTVHATLRWACLSVGIDSPALQTSLT